MPRPIKVFVTGASKISLSLNNSSSALLDIAPPPAYITGLLAFSSSVTALSI